MTEYLLTIGILAAINVILAVSFNVILGYGGLASIAHPIFYAVGAYSSARLGIARTWQNARLFPSLTVLDNLLVGARNYPGEHLGGLLFRPGQVHRAMQENRDKAQALLRRVKRDHKAGALGTDLSYGQQKLVALARGLMNGGCCLLLDEPMAGVEGRTYEVMAEVIREEAAAGTAVCIVEHNVGFIRQLCDRGVFMVTGRILADGPLDELMADPALTKLYFGA